MKKIIVLLSIILLPFCSSCNLAKKKAPHSADDPGQSVNSIVVLPIELTAEKTDNSKYSEIKKQENGAVVLTEILNQYFSENKKVKIISQEQYDAFNASFDSSKINQPLAVGKLLNSDAILTWNINRFEERDGGNYSIEQPASVAFDYRLLHVKSNQTLCSGVYDVTQKPFTDDILSFKRIFSRGIKWVTAKELAQEGIKSEFSSCKYLK